jgi:hypothetical protein
MRSKVSPWPRKSEEHAVNGLIRFVVEARGPQVAHLQSDKDYAIAWQKPKHALYFSHWSDWMAGAEMGERVK